MWISEMCIDCIKVVLTADVDGSSCLLEGLMGHALSLVDGSDRMGERCVRDVPL